MENKPDRELKYKLVKRGRMWQAFKLVDSNKWLPLLPDYTLASSVMGVVEAEMSHDIYNEKALSK